MRIAKIIIAVILILMVWVGYLGYVAINLKPKVIAEWGYVDDKTTELWFHIYLGKDIPISISIDNLTIEWAGIKIGKIENMKLGFMQDRVDGVLVIDNYKVIDALKNHIKNNEKSIIKMSVQASIFGIPFLKKDFSQEVETDILSYFDITTESRGSLIKTPAIEGIISKWGPVEDNSIIVFSDIRLYNPNSFPVPVSDITFDTTANGYEIADGKLIDSVVLPAKGTAIAKVEVEIDASQLPKVWAEHIKRGEESELNITVYLRARILNRDVRLNIADIQKEIKTDILGQINSMFQG
ncbi:MAG TPA: hypothetical protein EYH24_06415 [Thermococcus paralvinellae]|uniref:Water stress and hypersensitive response domain-containing protein n=1 Tax=Thermococcus paralvinellae TaxID=582419 RepID=A0A833E4I0_9EURY|nr:hypothetical protein [Thermococcus paralvinellae]